MRAPLCTLVAAVACAAQEPGLDSKPEPTAAGVVTNAKTQEPLRKAFVTLRPVGRPPSVEVTSLEGLFRFDDLPPGEYQLRVERAGFAPRSWQTTLPDRKLKIALEPLAAIHGRVTDEDGDPLPGVQVRVLRPETLYGTSFLALVKTVAAAPDGAYRADELLPGRYYVQAASEAADAAANNRRLAQPAFYPGVATPGQATPVEVAAGVTLDGTDIRLPWKPAFTVRGRVELPEKMKAGLKLSPEMGSFVMEWNYRNVPLNADETFEIKNVPEGDYVLRAVAGDEDGYQARLPLAVAAEVRGVRIRVERVPSVRLVATSAEPECRTPGWILFPSQPGGMPVGVSDKRAARVLLGSYRPVTDESGRCFVESMTFNGQPVGQEIAVAGDGVWQVSLSAGTGSLEGLVVGKESTASAGQVVPGAVAVLLPETDEARRPLYQTAAADSKGRFTFPHVAPGIYRILGQREWREPNELNTLEQLREQGSRIRVERDGRVQVIVRMD